MSILYTALTFYVCAILFAAYASRTTLRKMAGVGFVFDVGLMILLAGVFAGTGPERVGGALASIMISLTILAYRRWRGYYQLKWAGLGRIHHLYLGSHWINSTADAQRAQTWRDSKADVQVTRTMFYWEMS
ncbi:MAG: hypothetical protein KDA57_13935 [Planctomycetales bacterium]|nr:hypothetical protein [Planctomycetales bacterium]